MLHSVASQARPILGLLAALAPIFVAASCCTPPVSEDVQEQIDSPAVAFAALQKLLRETDSGQAASNLYYLITPSSRQGFGAGDMQLGWGEVEKEYGHLADARLLAIRYLDASPVPPREAAELTITYPDPESDGWIVERFLMLLTLEITRGIQDRFPQWRAHYPFPPFQQSRRLVPGPPE